jgi:hypothetical protein
MYWAGGKKCCPLHMRNTIHADLQILFRQIPHHTRKSNRFERYSTISAMEYLQLGGPHSFHPRMIIYGISWRVVGIGIHGIVLAPRKFTSHYQNSHSCKGHQKMRLYQLPLVNEPTYRSLFRPIQMQCLVLNRKQEKGIEAQTGCTYLSINKQ